MTTMVTAMQSRRHHRPPVKPPIRQETIDIFSVVLLILGRYFHRFTLVFLAIISLCFLKTLLERPMEFQLFADQSPEGI